MTIKKQLYYRQILLAAVFMMILPQTGFPADVQSDEPILFQRGGTVSFLPEISSVETGHEVTVDVVVTEIDPVFEAPVSIIYNPKLVEFIGATEGGFMKSDGVQTQFTVTENEQAGFIDLFVTRMGRAAGISGSGKLFSLRFKGLASGTCPLVFRYNRLRDSDRSAVAADMKLGTIYVK